MRDLNKELRDACRTHKASTLRQIDPDRIAEEEQDKDIRRVVSVLGIQEYRRILRAPAGARAGVLSFRHRLGRTRPGDQVRFTRFPARVVADERRRFILTAQIGPVYRLG